MGRLYYNHHQDSFDIDDRLLAHLRVVVMNKLRRGEPFMMKMQGRHGVGTHDLWMSPPTPLIFQFYGSRLPRIEVELVEEMMHGANGPDGLTIAA